MQITITYYVMSNADNSHFPHSYHMVEKDRYGNVALDFDYEATIDLKCIQTFCVNEIGFGAFRDFTKEKQLGFMRAIELLWENNLISREELENNQNFMDFIQEYFFEDAIEEFESEEE